MFGLTPYNNRKHNGLARRSDIFDLRSVFDDFFSDSVFPTFFSSGNPIRADIRENEKEYIVEAEIPGVKKEDIKLELRDDVLTVALEHNEEVNEEAKGYIRKERRVGSFCRSFYVDNVKNEGISAKYENGILTVVLPKSAEGKDNRHRIEIN